MLIAVEGTGGDDGEQWCFLAISPPRLYELVEAAFASGAGCSSNILSKDEDKLISCDEPLSVQSAHSEVWRGTRFGKDFERHLTD